MTTGSAMKTSSGDQLIEQYLGRLAEAARPLPPGERDDLVSDIREHIEVALDEQERPDEATVRNVLERLGPPEEIAEAAVVEDVTAHAAPAASTRGGGLERAALLVLLLSWVAPGVGWVVGAALVTASGLWSRRDKLVGLVGIPLATLLLLVVVGLRSAYPVEALILMLLASGPLGAAYLAALPTTGLRARLPEERPHGGPLEWAALASLLISGVLPPLWWMASPLFITGFSSTVPLLGWITGAVLVTASTVWFSREKLVALVAIPLVTAAGAVGLWLLHTSGVDTPVDLPAGLHLYVAVQFPVVFVMLMGAVDAAYLAWRLDAKSRAYRSRGRPANRPSAPCSATTAS